MDLLRRHKFYRKDFSRQKFHEKLPVNCCAENFEVCTLESSSSNLKMSCLIKIKCQLYWLLESSFSLHFFVGVGQFAWCWGIMWYLIFWKGFFLWLGRLQSWKIVLLVNKCVIFMVALLADCLQFTYSYSELLREEIKL